MSNDRDWVETGLLSLIAYGTLETMEAQQQQLRLMQRANDLNIMADKYPMAGRVVLEQWLDQYYYWLYGPPKHWLQTITGRLILPAVLTVVTAVVMTFIGMQDINYFLSNQMVNTTFGVTLLAGITSLVVCNLLGWRKAHQRNVNWPMKPPHTPEVY